MHMNETAFTWRGFMLDSCRHYLPPEAIRKIISAARLCGLNRMHWHLSDDQGWRIEISKYPALTAVGSRRGETFFGGVSRTENNSGFYTREEVRDIVGFARENGIEIIPEIEIPGHAGALLAACPEMGCRRQIPAPDGTSVISENPYDYAVEVSGGIFANLVCAGKDTVLRFLEDVLEDVAELFPFPAVHIGGDEALKLHWRRCPDCQRRMREEGLQDEEELQRWLVLHVGAFLAERGKKTIVWNDVLAGGMLPEHFIVQQWMDGEEKTRAFMENGGRVICSDHDDYYLDYPYGQIDVYHLWETPRIPAWAKGLEEQLLGIECPLWTERVTNPERAAFMLFPRLNAMGLKASGTASPDWPVFRKQVADIQESIRGLGLAGAPETFWQMEPDAAAKDREADRNRIYAPEAQPFVQKEQTLVLLEKTEKLMARIGIPKDFAIRAGDHVLFGTPGDEDGSGTLIRQLMTAVNSRAYGAWQPIPEKIWLDTMKCFPRFIAEHRRSYGWDGFDRGGWTVRQTEARLFRIGALEYELTEEDENKILSLHIPSDVTLDPEPLNNSLAEARAFMKAFFPAYENAEMICESWLLSPVLRDLLPSSSRILRFQASFDLTGTDPEDDAALEWVFHIAEGQKQTVNPELLPEDTSLQRKMKALILAGQAPGSARGRLIRPFA